MTFHPTRRDPSREHQVVIFTRNNRTGVFVSCNCLRRTPAMSLHESYDPIGETRDYPHTARLYNNPDVHRRPFGPRDRIRIG